MRKWGAIGLGIWQVAAHAWPALAQPEVLTSLCQAPQAEISSLAPLPRVAAALEGKATIRVLAIGSSSTVGIGASSRRMTYPAQFEEILEKTLKGVDLEVVNDGVSGEVATQTATRLKADVERLKPDLVLWQVGTNDAVAGVPVEDVEATVRVAIRWLKDGRADVVLVGLQYVPRFARHEHYTHIRTAIQQVAASENVPFVRRFDAMQFLVRTQAKADLLSGDGFHLNDLGYQCMAEHVAQAVVTSLYLRRGPALRP